MFCAGGGGGGGGGRRGVERGGRGERVPALRDICLRDIVAPQHYGDSSTDETQLAIEAETTSGLGELPTIEVPSLQNVKGESSQPTNYSYTEKIMGIGGDDQM